MDDVYSPALAVALAAAVIALFIAVDLYEPGYAL